MTFRSQMEERKQNTSQELSAQTGSCAMESTAWGGSSSKLLYFLIGGGIGAVTALMFAPKAGAALRQDISEFTRTGYDETLDLAQNVKAHTADIASNVKEHSAEIFNTVKQKADRMYGLASEKLSSTQNLTGENFSSDQASAPGDLLQIDDNMPQQQPHMRHKSTDIM